MSALREIVVVSDFWQIQVWGVSTSQVSLVVSGSRSCLMEFGALKMGVVVAVGIPRPLGQLAGVEVLSLL